MKALEFEVLEKGSRGTLGLGRKGWVIVAYPATRPEKAARAEAAPVEAARPASAQVADRDGEVFLHLAADGAYLKAVPPSRPGEPRRRAVWRWRSFPSAA